MTVNGSFTISTKKKRRFVKVGKIMGTAGFLLKGKESILWVGMSAPVFNHKLKSVSGSSSNRKVSSLVFNSLYFKTE